jgi:hypothetical protein
MNALRLTILFMAVSCLSFSCKKNSDDAGAACEEKQTMKVTFANTGSVPLRVVLATSLTPQFTPVNPVFSLDLAPGASVIKEFAADTYFNVWYTNCASACSLSTYYSKTYTACNAYDEKFGL